MRPSARLQVSTDVAYLNKVAARERSKYELGAAGAGGSQVKLGGAGDGCQGLGCGWGGLMRDEELSQGGP
jgi:hypothetical protein